LEEFNQLGFKVAPLVRYAFVRHGLKRARSRFLRIGGGHAGSAKFGISGFIPGLPPLSEFQLSLVGGHLSLRQILF
jgi:hypothetical protein